MTATHSRGRVRWLVAIAGAFAMLAMAACNDQGIQTSANPTTANFPPLTGNVNVGVSTDLPGLDLLDPGSNVRSGFDVELSQWLGQHVGGGFTPTFVDTAISDRQPALQSGRARMEVNVYSITDERRQHVDFAGPYLITQQGALTRAGDSRITDLNSLSGKTACAPASSTTIDELPPLVRQQTNVVTQLSPGACVDLLAKSQVDVVLSDELLLAGFAKKYQTVAVVPGLTYGGQERYGVALPHGDTTTCNAVRNALQQFIVDGAWSQYFVENFQGIESAAYRPDPYNLDPCQ